MVTVPDQCLEMLSAPPFKFHNLPVTSLCLVPLRIREHSSRALGAEEMDAGGFPGPDSEADLSGGDLDSVSEPSVLRGLRLSVAARGGLAQLVCGGRARGHGPAAVCTLRVAPSRAARVVALAPSRVTVAFCSGGL